MDSPIYDTLLSLPLFRGLSKTDFEEILGKIRFDFSSESDGTAFISSGDACDRFIFLLNGRVRSCRKSADGRLSFYEDIDAPVLFEAHSMFGIQSAYVRDYTAIGNIGLLKIEKQYLYSELYRYSICRMNLLNMLCGRIQNMESHIWDLHGTTIRERLADMVRTLSETPSGRKEIHVRMEDLAEILGETRLNVSKVLNGMAAEGKAQLRRGGFIIPALETL